MVIIEKIRAKLEELRLLEIKLKIPGAAVNAYVFGPKLTEKAALAFERKHKIELPADYRGYLTELGNGGVGPFNGIFALGAMDGNGGEEQPWPKGFVGKLSDPFPHRKTWNPVATRDDDDFDGDDGDDDPQWDPANMAGAFPICDHGCAVRSWLVVSGRERGRVWYDGRADGDGVWPQVDADGKHLTFGNWYLTWIDESLSALRKAQRRKR